MRHALTFDYYKSKISKCIVLIKNKDVLSRNCECDGAM